VIGYKATAFFEQPSEVEGRASNAPEYEYEWKAPDVMVMYCPKSIAIIAPSGIIHVGDNLTCVSDAYPEPVYNWYNYQTGERTTGRTYTLTEEGYQSYLCNATVLIRGTTCFRVTTRDITVVQPGYPLNTAVEVGTNATLDCKYGPTDINWIYTPAGQVGGLNVVVNCVVLPGVQDQFAVDKSDGGCGLMLLSSQFYHGGHYTCQESSLATIPSASEVIVLGSSPQCSVNATDGEIDEGDIVRMSCKVNFTGNMFPRMDWREVGGPEIDATTNLTSNYIESHIDVIATPPLLQPHLMRFYFNPPPPPQPPFINNPALNAPEYERTVITSLLRIRYCPRSTTITPDYIYAGEMLTCESDSFPPPTYEWTNVNTGEVTQGPTVTVDTEGPQSYRCEASNTFSGSSCSDSATFNFISLGNEPRNLAAVGTQSGISKIVAKEDEPVTIYCRHPPTQVSWVFTAIDQGLGVTVASGCKVVLALQNLFETDESHGGCNLVLKTVTPAQAGTYVCQDFESADLPYSSSLIILHSEPDCRTDVIGDNSVQLTCSVGYTGHVAPHMMWTDSDNQPIDSTDTVTDNHVESFIVVLTILPAIPNVSCMTHFTTAPTMPPSLTTPATNIPVYSYVWNSMAVNVHNG